jgi:hypothetical protein
MIYVGNLRQGEHQYDICGMSRYFPFNGFFARYSRKVEEL